MQGEQRDTLFPTLIDADELHRAGVTGQGIGVALIDTGAWEYGQLVSDANGERRILGFYDASTNREGKLVSDDNGHGTHMTSAIASSARSIGVDGKETGSYHGIAPDASLLIVKAFDDESRGSYGDIIRAITYVIAHKDEFNIRVMNLSFSARPQSMYWQDPINQAVMAAWDAGIVVVVSAGNHGPAPMTIGVPGNVPYVITTGAVTDHYTPEDTRDDYVASFSSAGPTLEGHVKPDLSAPGGHIMGIMASDVTLSNENPEFHDGYSYFLMSGTSQAAAVTSGVAALMLQEDPALTPDDVKCRLMASARSAVKPDGSLAYSVFQQGAGLINAVDAVRGTARGCANVGLDVAKDLAWEAHYGGPANFSMADGYYVATAAKLKWTGEHQKNADVRWLKRSVQENQKIWATTSEWSQPDAESTVIESFYGNGYAWNPVSLEARGHVQLDSDKWESAFRLGIYGAGGAESQFAKRWVLLSSSTDVLGSWLKTHQRWNRRVSESGWSANNGWNSDQVSNQDHAWNQDYGWNQNYARNQSFAMGSRSPHKESANESILRSQVRSQEWIVQE